MGEYYIENLQVRIEDVYDESDSQTPIVFILSKGADPSSEIKKFGESKDFKMYQKLFPISLGQG